MSLKHLISWILIAIGFTLIMISLDRPIKCWVENFADKPWLPSYCLFQYPGKEVK